MDDPHESIREFLASPPSSDPLSPTTRQERRSLLIVSLISVTMTWGGIIPQKFSAFGIELNNFKERNLLLLLAAVVIYFLAEFVIHAILHHRTHFFC